MSESPQHPAEATASPARPPGAAGEAPAPPPLRSVHTTSFPRILASIGASLAVTTYQAGKLIILRPESRPGGPVLNTHFRGFNNPMGFAFEPGRFALGTASEIWEFHDIPAVAKKLDTPETPAQHDAAFLPRTSHVTGNIQVHEMAWVPQREKEGIRPSGLSELWFINTRFSCLAARSDVYSFIPRWKPPFITALAPEDRCHLNGLCLRDGRPRYISALGETDKAGAWRENKRAGGVLMEIPSGDVLARGLSMPHSPRWRDGRMWLLESGNGGVGHVDLQTGKYADICRLPGFTRGFDFAGPYAFIGLSQIRESAVFSGIAIAELPQSERCCGVWAIDTRTGQVAGFVKFTDAVQEIFAVTVLPGMRWPEVLNEDPQRVSDTYELPDDALEQVPAEMRSRSDG